MNKLQEQDTYSHDVLLRLQQLAEQIAGLSLQQDLLLTHTVSGIHTLVDTLERALSSLRNMARIKCSIEVTKLTQSIKHMEQSLEEYKVCPLCMEHDQEFVLNCGHQVCPSCSDSLHSCPFCRTSISFRTRVFRAWCVFSWERSVCHSQAIHMCHDHRQTLRLAEFPKIKNLGLLFVTWRVFVYMYRPSCRCLMIKHSISVHNIFWCCMSVFSAVVTYCAFLCMVQSQTMILSAWVSTWQLKLRIDVQILCLRVRQMLRKI